MKQTTTAVDAVKRAGPKWLQAKKELQKKLGREPSDKEIAQEIESTHAGKHTGHHAHNAGKHSKKAKGFKASAESSSQSPQRLKELGGRFREGKKDEAGNVSYPVVIISQGLGNLADRNYYSKAAIESGVAVYEGKPAYFDHPTPEDEKQRPGRSVRELCGHYENCSTMVDEDGLTVLKADFVPMKDSQVIGLIEHDISFRKKYKNDDKSFVGISINGDGEGSKMEYDEFIQTIKPSAFEMQKIKQVEGQPINVITKFTEALSADFVTSAGARGRILKEQNKKRKVTMSILEAFRKLISGAEAGDKKAIEAATKSILEASKEEEDDGKKEAADKEHKEKAAKIMAHFQQCKSEMKQSEEESAKEYEARCMASALKKHEEESEEEDEKKEGEDGADDAVADDKKKKAPPKKGDDKGDDDDDEDEDEDESKESDEKKEGDDDKGDDDHADADKDKKQIKKMVKPDALQKEIESLKKEIEALKKEKKEADEKAEEGKKESAKAKLELEGAKKRELVESVLSKSGFKRELTEAAGLREILSKAKTKEEMTKLMNSFQEAWQAGNNERFTQVSSAGFTEISSDQETKTNDNLFK